MEKSMKKTSSLSSQLSLFMRGIGVNLKMRYTLKNKKSLFESKIQLVFITTILREKLNRLGYAILKKENGTPPSFIQ